MSATPTPSTPTVTPPSASPAPSPDARWRRLPKAPILARAGHIATWTGREMLVWGGYSEDARALEIFGFVRDGARFNPATSRWTKVPRSPVEGRSFAMSVWTGTEMLFYGGLGYEAGAEHGARFNPATGRWRSIPDAPGRAQLDLAVTVWDGRRMLIWGGRAGKTYARGTYYGDGIAYDPRTNTWDRIPRAPIAARGSACGVWTGTQLIVWGGFGARHIDRGGYTSNEEFRDGAIFTPATNTWKRIAASPLSARGGCRAFWTGSGMLVFGGASARFEPTVRFMNGALYDPATDSWKMVAKAPLAQRRLYASAWTGRRLFIWGGEGRRSSPEARDPFYADGAVLDVSTGRWTKLPRSPLAPRVCAAAMWTGSELIVWGGAGFTTKYTQFADGARIEL